MKENMKVEECRGEVRRSRTLHHSSQNENIIQAKKKNRDLTTCFLDL